MANTKQELAGNLGAMADAIRSKTGRDALIAFRGMASEIESIMPIARAGLPLSEYTWPEIVQIAELCRENPNPWSYLVGQSKPLDLGTYGSAPCLVVGLAHDTIAGTTDKAGMTFMVRKGLFNTQLGPTRPFSYVTSDARPAVLQVLDQFDEDVRESVKAVDKTYRYDVGSGVSLKWAYGSVSDAVWLFSVTELGSNQGESPARYAYFGSDITAETLANRRKMGCSYLTRTPDMSSRSKRIDNLGNVDSSNGDQSGQAVIGFCL